MQVSELWPDVRLERALSVEETVHQQLTQCNTGICKEFAKKQDRGSVELDPALVAQLRS